MYTNAKFITDKNFLYMSEFLVAAFSEKPAHTSRKYLATRDREVVK